MSTNNTKRMIEESFMDKLYIVMPAYNEQDNIKAVINEWYQVLAGKDRKSKLVVADGGSTDATHEILMNLKKEYSQLEILSQTPRQHGPKVSALYAYALKEGADYIFQTDSDGQTCAAEFEGFWRLRKEYDAVLGKRRKRGDGKIRMSVEKILCWILKLYFGICVPDANAPFRLMKASVVKKYLYRLPEEYNLPNVMLTTYFKYYQEKILFLDITFNQRRGGKNSINIIKIAQIGWNAFFDFSKFRKQMKKG